MNPTAQRGPFEVLVTDAPDPVLAAEWDRLVTSARSVHIEQLTEWGEVRRLDDLHQNRVLFFFMANILHIASISLSARRRNLRPHRVKRIAIFCLFPTAYKQAPNTHDLSRRPVVGLPYI